MFRYLELISSARVVGACIDKKTKQNKKKQRICRRSKSLHAIENYFYFVDFSLSHSLHYLSFRKQFFIIASVYILKTLWSVCVP